MKSVCEVYKSQLQEVARVRNKGVMRYKVNLWDIKSQCDI